MVDQIAPIMMARLKPLHESHGCPTPRSPRRFRLTSQRAIEKLGSDGLELATCREELLARATEMLDATEVRPSVLHGDLWVGNSGLVRGGGVAVFDPAGYVGHSEFGRVLHSHLSEIKI